MSIIKDVIKARVKYECKQFTKGAQNRFWPVIFCVFESPLFFVYLPYCPFQPEVGLEIRMQKEAYSVFIPRAVALIY